VFEEGKQLLKLIPNQNSSIDGMERKLMRFGLLFVDDVVALAVGKRKLSNLALINRKLTPEREA